MRSVELLREGGKGEAMDYLQSNSSVRLGKHRAREDRKKGKSLGAVLRWSLKLSFGLLVASALTVGVPWVRDQLYHSPIFDVAIREINGLHHISQSQVLGVLIELEQNDRNIVRLDLDRLRQDLELIPWVREAAVRRVLPDKLVINIVERIPVAFARVAQGMRLIDDEGVLLEYDPGKLSQSDFPVILGVEPGHDPEVLGRNRERVALYQQLIDSLDRGGAGLSKDVSEVHLRDLGNVSVILNEDSVLVHLGRDGFQPKFRRYLASSRELKKKYPDLDSVDLRYRDQVVIRTSRPPGVGADSRKTLSEG